MGSPSLLFHTICLLWPRHLHFHPEKCVLCPWYVSEQLAWGAGSPAMLHYTAFLHFFLIQWKQTLSFHTLSIPDVLGGYNGTIFAYGQTSSGKTHTMEVQCRRVTEEIDSLLLQRTHSCHIFLPLYPPSLTLHLPPSLLSLFISCPQSSVETTFETPGDNKPVFFWSVKNWSAYLSFTGGTFFLFFKSSLFLSYVFSSL